MRISVAKAALVAKVDERTIWRWIRSERIQAVKQQGRTLVDFDEVERESHKPRRGRKKGQGA